MAQTESLVWKGEAVTERMRAAQIAGVNRVMGQCVTEAKSNHNWMNRTGVLEGGIDIVTYAAPEGGGVKGVWGVHDVVYARIHELGGTIVPKRTKFLAVPVSEEAKRVGSPRQMGNLAYVQSIKGQPMLVNEFTGRVHFLLLKSVTIPARPYLRPAADVKYPNLPKAIREAYDKMGNSSGGSGA